MVNAAQDLIFIKICLSATRISKLKIKNLFRSEEIIYL